MKNYHTHTFRCKHAEGDVMDYAEKAVEMGITVLGMSEHTPLPDNRWPYMRMKMEELSEYLDLIQKAQQTYPDLRMLRGMECEYAADYHGFYKDELLGRWGLDYLIVGTHFYFMDGDWVSSHGQIRTSGELRAYTQSLIKAMESGLFEMVAHPDLFGNSYERWDENTIACSRDILEAAQALKIPLEINSYGLRKPKFDTPEGQRPMYPWEPFWELASGYDVLVVVNSDAHLPEDVAANMEEALALAHRYKLHIADLSNLEDNK